MLDIDEYAALVALMRLKPKSGEWSSITEQVSEFGSAAAAWSEQFPTDLFGASNDDGRLDQARRDIDEWRTATFRFHTFRDTSYPSRLRSVRQMPPIVFTDGELVADEVGVSVVGSRKASDRGLRFASQVASGLAAQNISVIAGLAEGIDTAAHRAALDEGGRTVAVLGNGLGHVYPRSNRELQREIARKGMLLTHFLPEYAPTKWSFLARNVTMSAYSVATVIVEAGEHSGTRTQAREAVAHGRPVILNSEVAEATSWGRKLTEYPGVYLVDSAAHAADRIHTILEHRALVDSWLGSAG